MALRIKEIAKAKGITMGEIADKMGINPVNLSASLNGNPTLNRLQEVAVILGVEVPDLFAQDSSYLNGHIETGNNIYPVKSREQFIGIIDKVDGIVHIPSSPRQDAFKKAIMEFCSSSMNEGKSGAMMMRYGVNEIFTLSFDSESKRFSLTQCIGNGEIKFNTLRSSSDKDIRHLVEQILSQIESIYEIGTVW